jgi:hypothetical protein
MRPEPLPLWPVAIVCFLFIGMCFLIAPLSPSIAPFDRLSVAFVVALFLAPAFLFIWISVPSATAERFRLPRNIPSACLLCVGLSALTIAALLGIFRFRIIVADASFTHISEALHSRATTTGCALSAVGGLLVWVFWLRRFRRQKDRHPIVGTGLSLKESGRSLPK